MPRPLTRLEAAEPLPMRPAIRIRDLRKVFGQLIAIDGVSLDIAPGEFFMIVGPSGCGKTTLLRILAGLDSVTSGAIEIETPHSQRPVNSMIFQGDSIFPWMTVWDNAAYGLKMRRVPSATVRRWSATISRAPVSRVSPNIIHTNFPAACVSACRSRARSPMIPKFC